MGRPRPQCYGCKREIRRSKLRRGPPTKRRCQGCRSAARTWETDLPKYCACAVCGDKGRCLPDDSTPVRWLCDDDFRVHALSRGKVKSRTTSRQTTEQDINLLAARHNSNKRWKRVDVWLVPLTPKCAYVMVRIILFHTNPYMSIEFS
jgi:hypothetical protein